MLKNTILALSLLAAVPAFAASSFYVTVPMLKRTPTAPVEDPISVMLVAGVLPDAISNRNYSQDLKGFLSVTGDTGYSANSVTWRLGTGALPAGLTLSNDGVVSGKPTQENDAGVSFQVLATYKGNDGQQIYSIKVGEDVLKVTQIVTGANRTCALTPAGAVLCWGDGKSVPTQVVGLESGVTHIAMTYTHGCAVVSGAAKCWGFNGAGQLGNGTQTDASVAVQVAGLTSGVTHVATGQSHSCAVVAGAAKCWGSNPHGQLGDGTSTTSRTPVQVTDLLAGVTSIVAGVNHSCAVVAGAAKCWGTNAYSSLGNGSASSSNVPVQVLGLNSGVSEMASGPNHVCALVAGAAKCWGPNNYGQLGNNTKISSNVPVQVPGLTSMVSSLTTSDRHSCAVVATFAGFSDGAAKCWGSNASGQLGTGMNMDSLVPVNVFELGAGVLSVSAGSSHTCAVLTNGTKCWGQNNRGQLGDGTTADRATPGSVRSGP